MRFFNFKRIAGLDEMISVVMAYIHHRKGVKVQIRYPQTLRELNQIKEAYNIALDWFEANDGSVKILR